MSIVSAKLIALTQPTVGTPASGPEDLVAFCARVSSGREYEDRGKDYKGLLKYCIKHKHWSVFEMVNAVVEVKAPRDISRQLLRHRSFSFQEFSQRYSEVDGYSYGSSLPMCEREYRLQDEKNRQNSLPLTDDIDVEEIDFYIDKVCESVRDAYDVLIDTGIAKECARVILPEGLTMSTLYMQGSLRSFIHYLDVRDDPGVTQHEHVMLAREIRKALEPAFPTVIGLLEELNGIADE